MALTTYNSFKSKICSQQRETLNFLKNPGSNKDLIVTEPDIGNGLVLLNNRDYIRKIEDLLQNYITFKKSRRELEERSFLILG